MSKTSAISATTRVRSSAVAQADARANAREMIVVAIGSDANSVEGVIPKAEQVREVLKHGDRVKFCVVGVTRGARGTQITLSRTHPNLSANCSRWRCPRSRMPGRDRGTEAGHRPRSPYTPRFRGLNAKRALHRPDGGSGCAT